MQLDSFEVACPRCGSRYRLNEQMRLWDVKDRTVDCRICLGTLWRWRGQFPYTAELLEGKVWPPGQGD